MANELLSCWLSYRKAVQTTNFLCQVTDLFKLSLANRNGKFHQNLCGGGGIQLHLGEDFHPHTLTICTPTKPRKSLNGTDFQVSEWMKVPYLEQFKNENKGWEMHISKTHNLVRKNIDFDRFSSFEHDFSHIIRSTWKQTKLLSLSFVDHTSHALFFIGFPTIFFLTVALKLIYLKHRRVFQVNGKLNFASE